MTFTLTPETEARVLAAAARRNEAPEAVVDAAIKALLREEPVQDASAEEADDETAYQERQAHLHRLMAAALEDAKTVEPEPYDSPARTYYRESEYGKLLAEKFRKQGFNV